MSDYTLKSVMAPYIQGLLEQKRALGYKYDVEEYILRRFDKYWIRENGTLTELTRESIECWMQRKPTEGRSSRSTRISVLRQLAIFMNGIGHTAYIPDEKYVKDYPVIHILSSDEIVALFTVIDNYSPKIRFNGAIRMSNEYKVLFRLILTTGLRRNEALKIKKQDVDFDTGTVIIRGAKGHKDRIVYISKDMLELLNKYVEYLSTDKGLDTIWLFPSLDSSKHISNGIGARFKLFWKETKYAKTCEKAPTIHSLRHTYVVLRMNQWMEEGVDLSVMMPYLSRQLGHTSINETFYYYHQVREAFRLIHKRDTVASIVIPEVRIR
ncbi:MAG: tyrosine-type recombinase/integrase [Lachnospiraceae bacterium]|nr:tyrosine-type recombinase/integrase [Lachnospiraceae bacterium]